MTRRAPNPIPREHDLRMHLGVILMALQMLSRPPTTPLQADQQELIDIINRATKAMQASARSSPRSTQKESQIRRPGIPKKDTLDKLKDCDYYLNLIQPWPRAILGKVA